MPPGSGLSPALREYSCWAAMVKFSCQSRRVFVAASSGKDEGSGGVGHATRSVLSVAFDASGRFVLAACGKVVRLFNSNAGILIQTFADAGAGYQVADVAPTLDGNRFASCAGKACLVWDVATAQIVRKFSAHDERVNAACHMESLLATASYDRCVRLFDLRSGSGAPAQVLRGARDSVSGVLWHGNSHQLSTASIDGCVRSYDCRKGVLSVDELYAPVTSICLTRDGECLLCSCLNGKLMLLDRETGELLASYSGHVNKDYRLQCGVLCDDSAVAVGSEDGSLCIWDLAGGGSMYRSPSDDATPMSALALHPSKGVSVCGSHSGKVEMFEIQSSEEDI